MKTLIQPDIDKNIQQKENVFFCLIAKIIPSKKIKV